LPARGRAAFASFATPGERACLLCRGDGIPLEHLPREDRRRSIRNRESSAGGRRSQVERATILATLGERHGNRTQAAKKFGISRRALIYGLRDILATSSGSP
jgi:DNA-binding NtrC family response regulator